MSPRLHESIGRANSACYDASCCNDPIIAAAAGTAAAVSPLLPAILVVPVGWATRTVHTLAQAAADRERLLADARRDPLTGLLNKHGFGPEAELLLHTDQCSARSTGLLFVDTDHFKAWNTRLGHVNADTVLRDVATTLTRSTRAPDRVGRFGGEELVVALPATDTTAAHDIAERIRTAVAATRLTVTDSAGGHPVTIGHNTVTVTIGMATTGADHTDLNTLTKAANIALLTAKQTSRNRVVTAPPTTTLTPIPSPTPSRHDRNPHPQRPLTHPRRQTPAPPPTPGIRLNPGPGE